MNYKRIFKFFTIFFSMLLFQPTIKSMQTKGLYNWQLAKQAFDKLNLEEAKNYLEIVASQRQDRTLQFMALLELAKLYLGQEVGTTYKIRAIIDIEKAKNILDQIQHISPISLSGDPAEIQKLILQKNNLLEIEKRLVEEINSKKRKRENGNHNEIILTKERKL